MIQVKRCQISSKGPCLWRDAHQWQKRIGAWLDNAPYGVIHRLASNGKQQGIAQACLDWAFQQCPNIRIDTHHNNQVMRSLLAQRGFIPCGTIFVEDGTPRIAFQKQE